MAGVRFWKNGLGEGEWGIHERMLRYGRIWYGINMSYP